MLNLNQLKLKTLLAGAMTLALFLTILISSFVNIVGFSSMFYEVTEQEHLPNVVERAKSQIESELRTPIALSQSVAQNTFVHDWIESGESRSELNDVLDYMQSFVDRNGAATVFWVVNGSNNYYTESGLFKQVSRSVERDSWFFNFIESGQDMNLNLDPNEETGALTVFVNVRAEDDRGNALGVAGLGYDVSSIISLVNDIQVGENGYMFLLDGNGSIVAHRDSSSVNKSLSSISRYGEMSRQILNSGSNYQLLTGEVDGEEYYVATSGLAGLDWKLVTLMPKSEITGKVSTVVWLSVGSAIVLAALFVLLAWYIASKVSTNITQVGDRLKEMSASGGDLTQRLDDTTDNELGYLAGGFNAILAKFSDLVKEIQEAEQAINQSVKNLRKTSEQSVDYSDEQQKQTQIVASAINEMGHTIADVSSVAHKTASDTTSAVNDTHETNEVMQHLSRTMTELAESMKQSENSISDLASQAEAINSVVDVINGISEQTNLLALNAAIEAARAGEQGRGFAVVADEVRTLASRTQDSTQEIRNQIERLQQATSVSLTSIQDGTKSSIELSERAQQASSALEAIRARFDSISEGNHQVATATEEQTTVVDHVNESAQQITSMANSIHESATSQIQEVETLTARAQHMREIVSQFKV
ncbi:MULTISPECIES: methyl-accepting chemotaxis protein [Gammaproteobacteria]|uniref:methyl-accepting chemotaxis protein n=1 Tax=Gammaproteobacteria TaxID=1236 RepID=UPI000DD0CA4C|nr:MULTISPECIES: methyl-accepting chemotaxis protein [Gammaproteobacteria]RTE87672.1 methyl-accepting chemotaxis protein [Aliidiomarina sp. B3213]TCZ92544.1 methyl-accepting chemotaxis protein [Lysobacter sp. N42]